MTVEGLTVDDLLQLKTVSDAQIHPDGRQIAFVMSKAYVENEKAGTAPISSLYVAQEGKEFEPITAGDWADLYPRWSPGGEALAFLSDRSSEKRMHKSLFILPPRGEAQKLPVPGNVKSLQWASPRRIFCLAQEVEDTPDDPIDFEGQRKPTRLWQVDVQTEASKPLSPPDCHVWESHSHSDGNRHVLLVSPTPYEWDWYRSHLALLDGEGSLHPLVTPAEGEHVGEAQLAPSGRFVAYLTGTASDPGIVTGDLMVVDLQGGQPVCLVGELPFSVNSFFWTKDDEIMALGYQEGDLTLVKVEVEWPPSAPRLTTLWSGPAATPGHRARFSINAERRCVALAREDDLNPADVWMAHWGTSRLGWKQVTTCNPEATQWQLGKTEALTWQGEGEKTIQGLLVKPSLPSQEPPPLFVNVHGGPTILHAHRFRASVPHWAQLLAAQGIAVLLPNPRGSAGWGLGFSNANIGDLGGGDIRDVLAGIEACIQQGLSALDRVALGGWSYGGYLSAWAAVKAPQLRAIIAGASITNWYSFHGTSNIPGFDETFLGVGARMQDSHLYHERSPVMFADQVTMPVLLLHGEKDPICDVGQAKEFYRAIHERGGKAQLVIYPREGHGIQEEEHVRDLLTRVVEFARTGLGMSS